MPKLCVDIRETRERIELAKYAFQDEPDWEVEVGMFDVADFFVGNILGIEYKEPPDFVGSIKSGRVFQQVQELKENFAQPTLMIGGSLGDLLSPQVRRGMNAASVLAAACSIHAKHEVPVFFADQYFGQSLKSLCKKAVDKQPTAYTPVRKSANSKDLQLHLVSSLPGVGMERAQTILDRYGTPLRAFKNIHNWSELHGIGSKTTDKVLEVLGAPGGEVPSDDA